MKIRWPRRRWAIETTELHPGTHEVEYRGCDPRRYWTRKGAELVLDDDLVAYGDFMHLMSLRVVNAGPFNEKEYLSGLDRELERLKRGQS